jgi:phosphate:Na+ symporter
VDVTGGAAMVPSSATGVLIELLGAVALLLWGTRMVRTGIMRTFGADLRHVLRLSLRHRLTAFLAGLGVTSVLQSSTATALVVAAFAGRGVVDTAPALAVMLGADLGSSLVAQVLSLNVHWLAPILILAGVITHLSAQAWSYHGLGRVAIGLGLMLLALRLILAASAPMREAIILEQVFGALAHDTLILVLVGALLTWLAHSSLAIVLLIMSLAGVDVLPLTSACALVLGANLGAAMPAFAATYADRPAARRVALGNLLFRLAGVVIAAPFVGLAVSWLQRLEADPSRVVVDFHTGFNLVLGLGFILFTEPVARLCARLLPDLPVEVDPEQPRHLDRSTLDSPSLALACAAREALRMGDLIETMLRECFEVFRRDDRQKLAQLQRMENSVDKLHEAIKLFVTDVSREALNPGESRRSAEILAFTTNLEHIGDIIDKSLLELADKKLRLQLRFSREGWTEIEALHAHVLDNLRMALGVFMSGDVAIARKLIDEKVAVRDAERQAAENHLARLRAGRPESIDSSALHLDILRDLKRIHSHICAIAYPLLDEAGQLYRSRLKRVERRALQEEQSDRPAPAAPAAASEVAEVAAPPPPASDSSGAESPAADSAEAPPARRTIAR